MVPSVVVRCRCSLLRLAAALFCIVTPPEELLRIICCGCCTFEATVGNAGGKAGGARAGGVACPLAASPLLLLLSSVVQEGTNTCHLRQCAIAIDHTLHIHNLQGAYSDGMDRQYRCSSIGGHIPIARLLPSWMLLRALALACLQPPIAHHRTLEGAMLLRGTRSNAHRDARDAAMQRMLHLVWRCSRQALLQTVASGICIGISSRIRFRVITLRQIVDIPGET